jgi:hypothetical protein
VALYLLGKKSVAFPFYICASLNGAKKQRCSSTDDSSGPIPAAERPTIPTWKNNDCIELVFALSIRTSRWVEASVAVERGPLVFSLKMNEIWKSVPATDKWGEYQEVYPDGPWNYGLLEEAVQNPQQGFTVVQKPVGAKPWDLTGAPIEIRTRGKRIPEWQLYNHSAGPLPASPVTHLVQDCTGNPSGSLWLHHIANHGISCGTLGQRGCSRRSPVNFLTRACTVGRGLVRHDGYIFSCILCAVVLILFA